MKIELKLDTMGADGLADRAKRLKPVGPPLQLDPVTSAVQFLRGAGSRAAMSLPAFYLFQGSSAQEPGACSLSGYPGTVLTHWVRFSAINTITLCCRQVFDHDTRGMTGAVFAKSSDPVLDLVAEYWAKRADRPQAEALSALLLLRDVFRECTKSSTQLLSGNATLGKRIGLLKQHANRSAAHLSLEKYEFTPVDCAHVVGALTLIGEVIRTFDDPEAGSNYFNQLDEAAFAAAKVIFPKVPDLRLFSHIDISHQAAWCWKQPPQSGQQMLLEQLPYAMGWF